MVATSNRGKHDKGRMSSRWSGQDSQKSWILGWDVWMGMKAEEITCWGLPCPNFLKQILFQRYQVELNTILILKSLELIYRYVGGFGIFEKSI